MSAPTQAAATAATEWSTHQQLLLDFREFLANLELNGWTRTRVDRLERILEPPFGHDASQGQPLRIAVEHGYSYKRFELRFLYSVGTDPRPNWTRLEPVVWNADCCQLQPGTNSFTQAAEAFRSTMDGGTS